MEIRLAGLEPESIVDGPGYRFTVFVQGCPHNCPGCHNPQTHDFSGGHLADTDDVIAHLGKNPLVRGLTLSGGDTLSEVNAGVVRRGTLTGFVWIDRNGDCVRQAEEELLSGVEVHLMDGAGRFITESTTTDENGRFAFARVAPGSYKLRRAASFPARRRTASSRWKARGTGAGIPPRSRCSAARRSRAFPSVC